MEELQDLRICVEKNIPENENALQQLRSISNNEQQFTKLKAAFYTEKLWKPGSTIRIKFLERPPQNLPRTSLNRILNSKDENGNLLKMDPLQKVVNDMNIIGAIIKIVNERIKPFIGLNLVFVKSYEKADIKIVFNPNGGAWSYIGTDCKLTKQNEPTMNFGWFDVATTIHEFGHALGMIHEHQNPRDNLIDWNEKKVYEWARRTQGWNKQTTYNNIIEKYNSNFINGSVFDPDSIMLYFFPGYLTKNNKGTHQNLRLSSYDVLYLNSMYPTKNIKNKVTPENFYKNVYGESLNKTMQSDKRKYSQYQYQDLDLDQDQDDNIIANNVNTNIKNKTVKTDFTIPVIVLSIILLVFIYLFCTKN